jgi:hypothetical protein
VLRCFVTINAICSLQIGQFTESSLLTILLGETKQGTQFLIAGGGFLRRDSRQPGWPVLKWQATRPTSKFQWPLPNLDATNLEQSRESLEDRYYDGRPLPSLLVAFKDRDAIIACFDEARQHMLEGLSEPTVCVVFSPKADDVKHAVRMIARNHGVKSLQDVVRVRIRALLIFQSYR